MTQTKSSIVPVTQTETSITLYGAYKRLLLFLAEFKMGIHKIKEDVYAKTNVIYDEVCRNIFLPK